MRLLAAGILSVTLFSCNQEKTAAAVTDISLQTPAKSEGTTEVEFKTLANFELPIADPVMAEKSDIKSIREALPKEVISLNSKKISIKGFMFPLKFTKEEKIDTFLLTADQGACCFGKVPALNEVIFCKSKIAYPDLRDSLLEIRGTITTEPSYNKSDEAVYLYTMTIDSIKELKALPPIQRPGFSY